MGLIFEKKYGLKARIISATPILSLILFFILGFRFDKWYPGWVVFLLIPIVPAILGFKKNSSIYPVIVLVVYLILGFTVNWGWHPGWSIFLAIPFVNIFTAGISPKTKISKKDKDDVVDII